MSCPTTLFFKQIYGSWAHQIFMLQTVLDTIASQHIVRISNKCRDKAELLGLDLAESYMGFT